MLMQSKRTVIGYVISDPAGLYAKTPEYGVSCLSAARAEAEALNDDFADELDGGCFAVMKIYADGEAELVT